MSNKNHVLMLIRKYLNKELSTAEEQELTSWISQHEDNRLLFKQMTNADLMFDELKKLYTVDKEAGWQAIINKILIISSLVFLMREA